MTRRKPVVAWADHYDTAPATLRFAGEPAPEWAEVSIPLVEADPDAERVLRAILAFRAGRLDRAKLEHAVERLEFGRLEKRRSKR